MIIKEDLRTKDGVLLVAKNQQVSFATVRRIQSFSQRGAVEDEVRVGIAAAASAAKTDTVRQLTDGTNHHLSSQ